MSSVSAISSIILPSVLRYTTRHALIPHPIPGVNQPGNLTMPASTLPSPCPQYRHLPPRRQPACPPAQPHYTENHGLYSQMRSCARFPLRDGDGIDGYVLGTYDALEATTLIHSAIHTLDRKRNELALAGRLGQKLAMQKFSRRP